LASRLLFQTRLYSWLEHNTNYLTIPESIATGAASNLLSPGNVNLINEISDHYADYKTEKTTKGQYDARRKKALDQLTKNIGLMKNCCSTSIRPITSFALPGRYPSPHTSPNRLTD